MKRGDVVTVAAAGDYGRPRPAVIVQTDALPAAHASVVVCQMTFDNSDGHLDDEDISRLNVALALVMGLAD